MPETKELLSPADLAQVARWPESWKRGDADVAIGESMTAALLPFLRELAVESAPRTLTDHKANLFLLGGEAIDRIHFDDDLRRLPGAELLAQLVDEEGGPPCRHLHAEREIRSYDATCRKLHRYLLRLRPLPAARPRRRSGAPPA